MNLILRPIVTLVAVALYSAGSGWARGGEQSSLSLPWPSLPKDEIRRSLQPGAGFSFTYDGKPVGPSDWTGWDVEQQELTTTLRHPSGLTVVRTARVWSDFDATEYTVVFRNDGKTDLPALSDINAIDVDFARPVGAADTVVSSAGASRSRQDPFPPKSDECFTITRTTLDEHTPSLSFAGDRGKPTRTSLPFFYVQNQAQTAGLFVGMGWAGQARTTFSADPGNRRLRINGGIEGLSIRLKPGEQISGPVILLGGWQGAMEAGTNRLRRLLGEHYIPGLGGKKLVPPTLYTTWFQIGSELDEKLTEILIDRAAEMGQEVFLIDASWYHGTPTAPFSRMDLTWPAISHSLGNWEDGHEAKRFPRGLRYLADRVRSRGMKFGLWFEPERAGKESRLAREHPEWMSAIPESKWLAVDLGRPEAQEYFCRVIDKYITELDIGYIRYDMNHLDLLAHWKTRDTPGRIGLAQIRHIEGLHRVEEYLLKKHPDVILENCASGGERVELTSLARRHTMWVSDAIDTKVVRYMLEGLNQFVPGNGQLDCLSIPVNEVRKPDFVLTDYAAQVGFGGAFGLSGRIHEWSPATRQTVRKNVDIFKQLRQYLGEDFYLLVPQIASEKTWAGWQFHDPRTQEGFIQFFRVQSPEPRRQFAFKGVDPAKTYALWDPYTNERFEMSGKKMLSDGLQVDLPELSSKVLLYKPAKG
jgi:alpha-galactosidase